MKTVAKIIEHYGGLKWLRQPGKYIRLENPPYMRLVIESSRVDSYLIGSFSLRGSLVPNHSSIRCSFWHSGHAIVAYDLPQLGQVARCKKRSNCAPHWSHRQKSPSRGCAPQDGQAAFSRRGSFASAAKNRAC